VDVVGQAVVKRDDILVTVLLIMFVLAAVLWICVVWGNLF
jgi:hypothetical protein